MNSWSRRFAAPSPSTADWRGLTLERTVRPRSRSPKLTSTQLLPSLMLIEDVNADLEDEA